MVHDSVPIAHLEWTHVGSSHGAAGSHACFRQRGYLLWSGCSCSRTHCQTVFRHHVQRLQVSKGNKQFDPIWINSIALCLLNLSQRENGVSRSCTCVRHRDENAPCNDRHRSQRPRCRSKARLDSRTLKTLQLRTGRGYVCRRTVVSRYP